MKHRIGWLAIAALAVGITCALGSARAEKPVEELAAAIEALKPERVAWRQIDWRSCLLEGLRESRESGKPVLLWVFIDRPADDARC
jgi:hypothetical protein